MGGESGGRGGLPRACQSSYVAPKALAVSKARLITLYPLAQYTAIYIERGRPSYQLPKAVLKELQLPGG